MTQQPSIPYIGLPGGGPVRLVWRPPSGHPLDMPSLVAAIASDPNPFPRIRLWGRA